MNAKIIQSVNFGVKYFIKVDSFDYQVILKRPQDYNEPDKFAIETAMNLHEGHLSGQRPIINYITVE